MQVIWVTNENPFPTTTVRNQNIHKDPEETRHVDLWPSENNRTLQQTQKTCTLQVQTSSVETRNSVYDAFRDSSFNSPAAAALHANMFSNSNRHDSSVLKKLQRVFTQIITLTFNENV